MSLDLDLVCELAARSGVEQALRELLVGPGPAGDVVARPRAVDEDNLRWFRRVVVDHGWPGRSAVGERGARDAFLLAQHAVGDPDFQALCLGLLRAAVERGEAAPDQPAYLEDRVRVQQGRPQRYGTQVVVEATGTVVASAIEDPDTVDARRRAVGLGPLAEYLAGFGSVESASADGNDVITVGGHEPR